MTGILKKEVIIMRVIVVDDDKFVTASLKNILEASGEIEVLAVGNSGEEAVKLYRQYSPDMLLMDIRMEGMTGLEAAEKILGENKDAKILFLTTFTDEEYIIKVLRIGGKGYILKQDFDAIVPAIKAVCSGQSVFGSDIVIKLPNLLQADHKEKIKKFDLTEKECSIMKLVAQGMSNKEISNELFLSEGTVRNYISNLLEKLHLRDRTQVAIFWLKEIK